MLVSDFDFLLPKKLIAQYPLDKRSNSRLLVSNLNNISDCHFYDLLRYLQPNDIIVRNNTKVIPARLFGQKSTGGKIEVMVERIMDDIHLLALIRSNKSPKVNSMLNIDNKFLLQVVSKESQFFVLKLIDKTNIASLLEQYGHIPLPPYIERLDNKSDFNRYQTVYAKQQGAVAAPTAGLHFDNKLLEEIAKLNIKTVEVTLHVGSGTFQPVRVANTSEHKMHKEWINVSPGVCKKIKQAKNLGGRVIAIGTTSLRALESASISGTLCAMTGETDIFITPGFKFNTVDVLLTNFHLPKSTLLMLVSAFSGTAEIKQIYQHAIKQKYRFFSYGDAMLLHKKLIN